MSVEIVTLTPDDWQAYRALRLESLRGEPQAFGTPYENMAHRPEEYWRGRLEAADEQLGAAKKQQKSWLLFARENGRLVGMIGAFLMENEEESQSAEAILSAEIVSLYVSPSARGRRAGKALMAAILEALQKSGLVRRVVLGVVAEQSAAVALYQAFGFQTVAEHTDVMGDGLAHKGYKMEKMLV